MPLVHIEGVSRSFKEEGNRIYAVKNLTLSIPQGDFVFIVGSSGAGKSTMLKLLSGELRPDSGKAFLDDTNLCQFQLNKRFLIRRSFGHVWQESRLMRKRTIAENLLLAARTSVRGDEWERVTKALALVGMRGVEGKFPGELSGGECRKIELARALINSPPILVLDELTANLDADSIWDTMYLLEELNRNGTTIIMATHAKGYVNVMRRRVVTMVDGRIVGDVQKGRYGDLR